MVQIPLAHNIFPPDPTAQSALTLAILAAPVDPKVINPAKGCENGKRYLRNRPGKLTYNTI
jgi:hypothetical protein